MTILYEMYDDFIGDNKEREKILKAWPKYIKSLQDDPDLANPYAKPAEKKGHYIPRRYLRDDRTQSGASPAISNG